MLRARGARRAGRAAAAVAAAFVLLLPRAPAAEEDAVATASSWTVVVHPSNPLRRIDRARLERIYRRRERFWPDGTAIVALNLPGGDDVRRAFTSAVLGSDEEELATYWNRQYFQGLAPPAVLQSSAAVRAYVAATPEAIGYVRREDVDGSVAAVEVTGGD